MTPKEKAEDLYNKFLQYAPAEFEHEYAVKLALICIEEIGLYRQQLENEYDEDFYHAYGVEEYWEEVRQELKNF